MNFQKAVDAKADKWAMILTDDGRVAMTNNALIVATHAPDEPIDMPSGVKLATKAKTREIAVTILDNDASDNPAAIFDASLLLAALAALESKSVTLQFVESDSGDGRHGYKLIIKNKFGDVAQIMAMVCHLKDTDNEADEED